MVAAPSSWLHTNVQVRFEWEPGSDFVDIHRTGGRVDTLPTEEFISNHEAAAVVAAQIRAHRGVATLGHSTDAPSFVMHLTEPAAFDICGGVATCTIRSAQTTIQLTSSREVMGKGMRNAMRAWGRGAVQRGAEIITLRKPPR